jgi:hypothetical protein
VSNNPTSPAWRARAPRNRKVCNLNVRDDAYRLIRAEALTSGRTLQSVADEVVNRILDAAGAP